MSLMADDGHTEWILDGYPRRVSQAVTLQEIYPPTMVINLELSDEEAIMRLLSRRVCANGHVYNEKYAWPKNGVCWIDELPLKQRPDDTPEGIATRLKSFHEQTQPVIDWYNANFSEMVVPVKASMPPSAIMKFLLQPKILPYFPSRL
jgi:adenylate kinase